MRQSGRGFYQEVLRKITKIQIIYALLEKPLTFNQIKDVTRIQGSAIKNILDSFIDQDVIIRHRFKIDVKEYGFNNSKPKARSYYHIADLDNRVTLELIADPTIHLMEKYLEENEHLSETEFYKYGFITIKKLKNVSVYPNPYDYANESLIVDVRRKIRDDFYRHGFLTVSEYEERKRKSLLNEELKKTKEFKEIEILERTLKKTLDEEKYSLNELFRNGKPIFLQILSSFIEKGYSKWDFLIWIYYFNNIDNKEAKYAVFRYFWKIINYSDIK